MRGVIGIIILVLSLAVYAMTLVETEEPQWIVSGSQVLEMDSLEWEPLAGMVVEIEDGGPLWVNFQTHYRRSVAEGAGAEFVFFVDGVEIEESFVRSTMVRAGSAEYVNMSYVVDVGQLDEEVAVHEIAVYWRKTLSNDVGILQTSKSRQLSVVPLQVGRP
ncbi:MAG TPA: hypothetical protein VLL52_09540 [Anaerolineae bacterium]|nr:hypothetical protein [Anaerolineae bacterium]